MAVGAIGGANAQALATLQKQLQADQRQLAEHLKSKAGQQPVSADQATVAMDQTQVAAASRAGSVDVYL